VIETGPIWLIGCGNMAGAMLRRWLDCGLDPAKVTVVRKSGASVADGVTVLTEVPFDGEVPAIVLLGVKPQMIDQVAPQLAGLLAPETLLVSILAGVELDALRQRFPAPRTILRAMPNTPVALGQGAVVLCGTGLDDRGRTLAAALMAPLGLVEWLDESLFHAITALAGSGPAFLFRYIDALAAAGIAAGLAPAAAERLAKATVAGAAALAIQSNESPNILAARVTSPGGTTQKGLDVLDANDALKTLLTETIAAATNRSKEMAEAARQT
jgi:pyrroline-5-carboxylate reductase